MSILSVEGIYNYVREYVDSDIGECSVCKSHLMLDSENDQGKCPNCKEGVLYLNRWRSTITEELIARSRLCYIKIRDKIS